MLRLGQPKPAAGRYDAWPKLAWGAAPAYSRMVSRMRVRRRHRCWRHAIGCDSFFQSPSHCAWVVDLTPLSKTQSLSAVLR